MKFKNTGMAATLFGAAVICAPPAQADAFHALFLAPDISTVSVDAGIQNMPLSFAFDTMTVSSSGNAFTFNNGMVSNFLPNPFVGLELIDVTGPDITNVVFDPSSTLFGFDDSRINFDSSHIWLNLEGTGSNAVSVIGILASYYHTATVDVTFADPATDMPEPATLALFGVGLAGLGALRQRKR